MTRVPVLATIVAACGFAMGAEPVGPRADALDLLFLHGELARLEIRVEIDGKSVPTLWDETFAKLLAFHDRDGDGVLDRTEAGRLPSAFALRQVLWGQFTPHSGDAPPFADLDLDRNGKISVEELAHYYRRAGLGGVLVGVGKPTATEQLTDAILKHLDTNRDGKVDEAEWKAAAEALRKLDANDDELIGPGELVEKTIYPGATGAILFSSPSATGKPDPILEALPLIVLPLRLDDRYWLTAVAEKRPNSKASNSLRKDAPAATWNVRLGEKPSANARMLFASNGVRLELRADDGKLKEQTAVARKRFQTLFAECDTNADGTLDEKELAAPKAMPFRQMATTADRDGDGKLSANEFAVWLDLQEQIARGHVLMTLLDHGTGLFEFLDADHDGSLSVRELRSAWDRLREIGCVTEKGFDRTKLPRQLLATVSRGQPVASLGKPNRTGPAWFLAMDRNGDGDVSAREWIGDPDLFHKLDADGDGLLSASEAEKATKK